MTDITAAELAMNAADMADLVFTEDVTVVHITRPTDATTGSFTETPTTVWTGKANRKPAVEGRQNLIGAAAGEIATALSYWEFSFPVGVPIVSGDRIESAAGRVYEVLGLLDKSIQMATYVYAQERSSGPGVA